MILNILPALNTIEIPEKFQHINKTIFTSSSSTLSDVLQNWPNILIALGLIGVGWLIMKFIQFSIVKVSSKISFHKLSEKSGFTHFLKRAKIKSAPSKVVADFLGGYIFTTFFLAASNVLGLSAISDFLNKVIRYIPQVIVALFIVLIGSQIANTVSAVVESTLQIMHAGASRILALVARGIIITFTILAALFQLDIAEDLVTILFTGVVAMITLAGGLAVGLGSKDFIRDLLNDIKNNNK